MSTKILILNGPNLNLVGSREPEHYGSMPLSEYLTALVHRYEATIEIEQSNHEGDLIDALHRVGFSYAGIVLNAGGYTHTSVALRDAVAAIKTPVIEVHISNIYAREAFRSHSLLSPVCTAIVSGLGLMGYDAALNFLLRQER